MCHLLVLLIVIASCCAAEDSEVDYGKSFLAYDFLYNEGVSMYLEENWKGCTENLELAVKGWHWWQDSTASCRKNCSREAGEKELLSAHMSEDDRYYERALYSTHCLVKCKKNAFGAQIDRVVESSVTSDFVERKPYDYLQLCYYKLGQLNDAANAAATILAIQPNNTVMANNLNIYMEEGELKGEDIINLELKPFGQDYIKGTLAYGEENYDLTITYMEKSLKNFFEEYENCRFLCESPFDQGWHPDFVSSVANHFTFTLRCKRRCFWELTDIYGEIDDNFLPSYFDYLQYSYFQKNDVGKSCEAVATYLILKPEDEVQTHNKEFYLTQDGVTEDMFVPRKEIVALKEREDFEENLVQSIEADFAFLADEFWDEEDGTSETIQVGESEDNNTTATNAEQDTDSVIVGTAEPLHEEL